MRRITALLAERRLQGHKASEKELKEHVNDWTVAHRDAYLSLMCRELLRIIPYLRGGDLTPCSSNRRRSRS